MSETLDPYRAPTSATVDIGTAEPVVLVAAGKGRRLLTFLIDYLGQLVLTMLAVIPLIIVMPDLGPAIEGMNKFQEILLGLVGLVVYYSFFEGIWGRTPGKWICGTRVVDESGRRASFGQVLGRTFSRMIPFEAFSLLFAADDDPRGWHDSLPKTRVVKTR